jgi:hypothetical protein
MAEETAWERCAVCCLCVYRYEWCVEAPRKNAGIASYVGWTLATCWVHTLESLSGRVTVAECWCGGVGVTQTVGCWWQVTEVFQLKYTVLKCSCVSCVRVNAVTLVLCRSHQSTTASFIGISHVYAWGTVSVMILPNVLYFLFRSAHGSTYQLSFTRLCFCRLYILPFSIFWRPHSGIMITVVWDVTPCRLAHVYLLPLLYGVRGSKFMRNVRWYHSVRGHALDYHILVHLLQQHTVLCLALLRYNGEKMLLELGTTFALFLQPNAELAV